MQYKFSRCIALQVPEHEKVVSFYRDIMGLEVIGKENESIEFKAGENRLFIDKGPLMGPILEFLVPDQEAAKKELIELGCSVVVWEGKGKCCFMRDPFGFLFNVFEEPDAFK